MTDENKPVKKTSAEWKEILEPAVATRATCSTMGRSRPASGSATTALALIFVPRGQPLPPLRN
jgi:hypothetical protein